MTDQYHLRLMVCTTCICKQEDSHNQCMLEQLKLPNGYISLKLVYGMHPASQPTLEACTSGLMGCTQHPSYSAGCKHLYSTAALLGNAQLHLCTVSAGNAQTIRVG